MTKNPSVIADKITLQSIKTLKGIIEDVQHDNNEYSFEFETTTNISRDRKLLRFILDTTVNSSNRRKKDISVAFYSIEFIFEIEGLEDFLLIDEENEGITIRFDLGVTIAGIAYSTVRGIIHVRTQGTALNGVILPVIDPANLLKPKQEEVSLPPRKRAPRKR